MTITTRARFVRMLGAASVLALSLSAVTGCDDDEASALLGATTGTEARASSAAIGAPTLDELRAELDLTDEQAVALAPALSAWQSEVEARHAAREERRAKHRETRGSGRHERMNLRAHAGERGRPVLDFIAESGQILETRQMVRLAEFLAERHDAHVASRPARGEGEGRGLRGPRGGPGPHGPGMIGGGAAFGGAMRYAVHELGADRETLDALRDLIHEQHDVVKPVWDGFREGTVTADALRDALGTARENVEAKLGTLFDGEQLEAIDAFTLEMRGRGAERQLENLDARLERHASLLTKALDLDAARAEAVTDVIEATMPEWRETIEASGSGAIELEESIYRTIVLREKTRQTVRAQLTPDQAEVFDALGELMPHR